MQMQRLFMVLVLQMGLFWKLQRKGDLIKRRLTLIHKLHGERWIEILTCWIHFNIWLCVKKHF